MLIKDETWSFVVYGELYIAFEGHVPRIHLFLPKGSCCSRFYIRFLGNCSFSRYMAVQLVHIYSVGPRSVPSFLTHFLLCFLMKKMRKDGRVEQKWVKRVSEKEWDRRFCWHIFGHNNSILNGGGISVSELKGLLPVLVSSF